MTMKNSVFSLFFILCILPGCQRAKEDIVLLDLTQMLTEKLYQNQDMPSLELVSELQLDNDVLLGGFPHLFYCSRDLYGISDRNHLYFFRRSDGKLYSDLTHIGRGPSEYLYPMHVSVRDTVVCISDKPEIGKAIFYSTSGKYLRTDKIPVNSIYEFLDENHYALLYDNREDKSFEVYFNNGTLVRECSIDNGPKNTSNTYVAVFQEVNGKLTVKPALRDTCYRISFSEDVPWMIMDKGKFRIPDDYLTSFDAWSQNQDRYITLESYIVSGNYVFVSFNYANREHHEIWDLVENRIVFKSYLHEENIFSFGPKLETSREVIPFWPSSSFESNLYCVWGDESPRVIEVRVK